MFEPTSLSEEFGQMASQLTQVKQELGQLPPDVRSHVGKTTSEIALGVEAALSNVQQASKKLDTVDHHAVTVIATNVETVCEEAASHLTEIRSNK